MGKIKDTKFRFHQKSDQLKHGSKVGLVDLTNEVEETSPSSSSGNLVKENVFAGLNIDFSSLAKTLDKSDTLSLSGKSHREVKNEEQSLPKKEKMKRRHERFIQKLEVMYEANKSFLKNKSKSRKTKKAKKVSPLNDLAPLLVPLEESELEDHKPQKTKPAVKNRSSMKVKDRLREEKKDYKYFSKVLNDPVFKSNPAQAISLFLKQKIAEKRPDLKLD